MREDKTKIAEFTRRRDGRIPIETHMPPVGHLSTPPSIDFDQKSISTNRVRRLVGFLWPFFRSHRRMVWAIGLILAVEGLFNAAFSLALKIMIDDAVIPKDAGMLVLVVIALGVIGIVVSAAGVVCDYLNARLNARVVTDIRGKVFGHLQDLPLGYHSRTRSGAVLSRFSGDMVAIEGGLTGLTPWCLLPLFEVFFSVIILFIFNAWLTLLALLIFPLAFLGPRVFAGRALLAGYEKKVLEGETLAVTQDNLTGQPVIQAFGLGGWARGWFAGFNARLLRNLAQFFFLGSLIERAAGISIILLHVCILSIGGYMTFHDQMSIGTLVAFESIFLSLCYALTYITQYIPALAQAAGAADHLHEILRERPTVTDAPDARPLLPFERDIEFRDVTFSYTGTQPQLAGLCVRIPRGAFVAFVGGSGAGKSTVLNLLLRFYDPTSGEVLIDGQDLRGVTLDSLRGQMGIVFQESLLFNMSIRENIRLGNLAATDEQVIEAARMAEMHDVIVKLPQGYDTLVGERGGQLSGGQRQRLAIARALVRDPRILILDEATSALDPVTEAAIHGTILRLREGRTVLAVTHRLTTVTEADTIFVLDHGMLVESGRHEELLARGGPYLHLWTGGESAVTGSPE